MSKTHKKHVTPNPTFGQAFHDVLQSVVKRVQIHVGAVFAPMPHDLRPKLAMIVEKKRNTKGQVLDIDPSIVTARCFDGTVEGLRVYDILHSVHTDGGLDIVTKEVKPYRAEGQMYKPSLPFGKLNDRLGMGGLQGMTLRGVNGSGTDFSGMDLRTTKFENCDLTKARFEDCQIEGVVFDPNTILSATQWVGAQGRPAAINYKTMDETTYLEFRMRGVTSDEDLCVLSKVYSTPDALFDEPVERLRLWAEAGLANLGGLTSAGKRVAAIAADAMVTLA